MKPGTIIAIRPSHPRAAGPISKSSGKGAATKATTIADVVKATRVQSTSRAVADYASQNFAQRTLPTKEQIEAEGGGVIGVIKAFRKLNR